MKEIVCDKILRKKPTSVKNPLRKELKRILPRFYTIDSGEFGIFYISKFVPRGGLGGRAKIFYLTNSIKISDKKLYPILKRFGEKHGYVKLVKCWKGCEQEVIEK